MADVRALLKAKRQQDAPRINHPYASYSASTNQLRCAICESAVKNGSAGWEGHIGSKAHRVNVGKVRAAKEQQEREEAEREQVHSKRKADDDMDEEDGEREAKRMRSEPAPPPPPPQQNAGMAGFFSDPSRSLPTNNDSDSEDEDNENSVPTTTAAPVPDPKPRTALDDELAQFELMMSASSITAADEKETKYQNATVFAEPQMADSTPAGFPPAEEAQGVQEEEVGRDEEEEARKKKETDDRELIMDRLMDEERAQEDADMKVIAMKAKIEALKKKRRDALASKPKS